MYFLGKVYILIRTCKSMHCPVSIVLGGLIFLEKYASMHNMQRRKTVGEFGVHVPFS